MRAMTRAPLKRRSIWWLLFVCATGVYPRNDCLPAMAVSAAVMRVKG